MSMTDPVADLLTRIRNGQSAGKANISLDRKILADIAMNDPESFKALVASVK